MAQTTPPRRRARRGEQRCAAARRSSERDRCGCRRPRRRARRASGADSTVSLAVASDECQEAVTEDQGNADLRVQVQGVRPRPRGRPVVLRRPAHRVPRLRRRPCARCSRRWVWCSRVPASTAPTAAAPANGKRAKSDVSSSSEKGSSSSSGLRLGFELVDLVDLVERVEELRLVRPRLRPPPPRPTDDPVGPAGDARADVGVFGGSGFYSFLDDVTEVAVDTPFGAPVRPRRRRPAGRRAGRLPPPPRSRPRHAAAQGELPGQRLGPARGRRRGHRRLVRRRIAAARHPPG